jgi:hypothetical protein
MTAAEWLAALRRSWLVLVAGLLCTMGAVVLVHWRPIAYQGCAAVAATPPPTGMDPNVYSNTRNSLVELTGIVTLVLMADQEQQDLRAAGLTATYTAQLHNTGTSETPGYSEPLADLCASSYDYTLTVSTVQALVSKFGQVLHERQAAVHVPAGSFATETVISPPSIQPVTGRPSQAYIGVGLFGLACATAITVWTDRYRRRSRDFGGRPPGPSSGCPPERHGVTAVSSP